jgi:N12 class adenine-specific DNA methylase/SAM-dependent methyltransferase
VEDRPASGDEQQVLARWAGWGALPDIFDGTRPDWGWVRTELADLLDEPAWAAAARSCLNAHYTSAEVVTAVWTAVAGLGFAGGRILEPGCGAGNFLALRPDTVDLSHVVGVELDPTTAGIARRLYPSADIRAESFADTRLPDGWFDLVVGNVPFAKVVLHDRVHNPGRLSLHNYFIVKSLRLTRRGGLVALLTSRWTLDARNPAARREMAELAELVGAVRLPRGAFAAAAGTDAICDLLLLRRHHPLAPSPAVAAVCPACQRGRCDACRDGEEWWCCCQAPRRGESWATVAEVEAAGGTVAVNEWFARHPQMILGELRAGGGAYGADELTVAATGGPLGEQLRGALDCLVAAAGPPLPAVNNPADRPGLATATATGTPYPGAAVEAYHKEGSLVATATGGFARISAGRSVPYTPSPKTQRDELRALLELRDALAATLAAQAGSGDDTAWRFAQQRLNRAYDHYRDRYGPLNRSRMVRTGRLEPRTGDEIRRRLDPPMGGFRRDPDLPAVLALEIFDPDTQTGRKAAVFSRRVVGPRRPALGADTAADALAVCLDQTGRVDLARIAGLLGVDAASARSELGELVWEDPQSGKWIPAGRYLSGDVRAKLAAAETAAAADPRFAANASALRAVLPADLGPDEIGVRLGVPWIDTDDLAAFIGEVLGAEDVLVEHVDPAAGWKVAVPSWQRRSVAMTSEWGTRRADAVTLLEWSLEQRPARVYDTLEDGRRVLNSEETVAARAKQEALEERFGRWIWQDPQRSARLAARYNRLFNSLVPTVYDGSHQSFPGLAETFSPRPYQADAIWRIVCEPCLLLGHAVGAGKTSTMVIAGMEMRRLGLVRKPAYVVPNHMLEQFSAELLQLYPQARVLVATRDTTTPAARKTLVARCATGEWDAIVITHSAFERIPVSVDAGRTYLEERIAELRAALDRSRAGAGLSVKRLEATLARAEERHKRLLDVRRDDGVSFEQTGIDYLFVDEAHAYKNLAITTHVEGVSAAGSQRASDLELKLHTLRRRHGPRVATFATATFVANSIAELYVMQRYLQPHSLEAAGLASFDAWAATFGRTVTSLELAPDGGSYRLHTRFARFVNVPELLTMFGQVADVRPPNLLALPTPRLVADRADTAVADPSPQLQAYVATLVERAEHIRARAVHPTEDNMLKVSGDGRKAALDLRLVAQPPDPDGGKITLAAQRIAHIWAAHRHDRYPDGDGNPHPRPGSLQLVFCDLGTPTSDGWNVYDELKSELVARGLAAEQIRYIHDARTDQAKADLFAACRDGRVAILVGSTEKMGFGTNVQTRAVALHHLDCPWRPADIEQREGRILRQGNNNPAVEIVRYVTEGSFDVFMWQTVERKAAFIHQVTRGEADSREIDDVGDQALSYAQVKALATGNPLILERAGIEAEAARLERLAHAHHREQRHLAARHAAAGDHAQRLHAMAAVCQAAAANRIDTRADRFAMTIAGQVHTSRIDAGVALRHAILAALDGQPAGACERILEPVATLGGFPIAVERARYGLDSHGSAELHILPQPAGAAAPRQDGNLDVQPLPLRRLPLERAEIARADPAGLIAKLEGRLARLEETATAYLDQAQASQAETAAINARLGQPFEHQQRLRTLQQRLRDIDETLTPSDTNTSPSAADRPGHQSMNHQAQGTDLTATPPPAQLSSPTTEEPARTSAAEPTNPARLRPGEGTVVHQQHGLHTRLYLQVSTLEPTLET